MAYKIKKEQDPKFLPLLTRIKERILNMSRTNEKGIVNQKAKSSLAMRDNGDINTVSSKFAQHKLSADGKATNVATQDVTITNTKYMTIDEIIINNHKFNNLLFEYVDPKIVLGNDQKLVTGLGLEATVLTKSWEPTLQRYVMIRRPARFAMFNPEVNTPEVPENLSIDTGMKTQFSDMYEIQSAAERFDEFSDTSEAKE